MSYGQAELYTLLTDSTITDLLTQGEDGIFYDTVVPDNVGGVTVGAEDSTINYYRISPVDGGIKYLSVGYSINCMAQTMAESEAIARAVYEVVNRHSNGSVYFWCQVLPVIPPISDIDNYNSLVEVLAKGRSI